MGIPSRWWAQRTLCLVGTSLAISLAVGTYSRSRAEDSTSVRPLDEMRRQVGDLQFLIEEEAKKIQPHFDAIPNPLPLSEAKDLARLYGLDFTKAMREGRKAEATAIFRRVIALGLKSVNLADQFQKLQNRHHFFMLALIGVYEVYVAIGGWEEAKVLGMPWSVGLPATMVLPFLPVLPVSYWLATKTRHKFRAVMRAFFQSLESDGVKLPWSLKKRLEWIEKEVTMDLRSVSSCARMLEVLTQ